MIPISNNQVKEGNYPPKVGLKDSRAMPDITAIRIAENFPLNEPLMHANLTSYFAITIFLSGLDLPSVWM